MEQHVLELIPAYALNCLDEADQRIADDHLAKCTTCQAELRAYREVVGQLASVVPQVQPRAELKGEVVYQIKERLPAGAAENKVSWKERLAAFFPQPSAWAYLGAVVIIVLVISNLLLWNQTRSFHPAGQPAAFQVVNLSGTETSPEARGMLVISQDGNHGTLVVDGLPYLGEEQQYQLWLLMDGIRTDGGIFSVDLDGYGSIWIDSPRPLADYTNFGVTIEPAGGSPGPTGPKILGSDL
jgi:anti-sigma-K factor RskA